MMRRMLLHWIIIALAFWVTSRIVPGFVIDGAAAAFIAAIVIGFINATIGRFLKIFFFPITIATLGFFALILNAILLEIVSSFVPGFHLRSSAAAFCGAIVLSLVNMLLKRLIVPAIRN